MKKSIILIFESVFVIGVFLIFYFASKKAKTLSGTSKIPKNILVVYYSATGSTEKVAKKIAKNLNADIFLIEPEETYTSEDLNYSNSNSRVSKEHDDESLRDIKLKKSTVDNFDKYDTILIGYPIWRGIAA